MKQYTSWGNYVTVETVNRKYDDVILCPSIDGNEKHLLEYYNGDVIEIDTIDMISISMEGKEKYIIQWLDMIQLNRINNTG